MSVTFTIGSVVFTFNTGDVTRIQSSLSSSLDFDSMPQSPPSDSLLYDYSGVTKTIQLEGSLSNNGTNRLSSGSAVTLDEQRQWIESLLNGDQGSTSIIFHSNYSSTFNGTVFIDSHCLIADVKWQEETGNPTGLPFTITFNIGDV